LYVYAVISEPSAGELPVGLAGEPLRVARCGGLLVAAGEQEARPRASAGAAGTLAAHDAAVRRLAGRVEAILPVRFGEWVRDERELEDRLAPRRRELAEALERVRGCEQMTLRLFGEPEVREPEPEPDAGPGTRYLAARRRELEQARSLPELEPVRSALLPLVRAERIERKPLGRLPGLLGTAYHLVRREDLPAYREALREAEARLAAGRRLVASGPWPPYAFAPGIDREEA
jgi:hypothetical protein